MKNSVLIAGGRPASYALPLVLQLFADVPDPGVNDAPAAEEPVTTEPPAEPAKGDPPPSDKQTGVDDETPAAEVKDEKDFAKALKAREAQLEKKYAEKYKDHEHYKQATEYLQKTSGIDNLITLKEEIELANLQERADKEKVPANVLKRIDELETKAAKGDELETQLKQQQEWQDFESNLKDFAKDKEIDGKPVDHMALWKFMHDEGVSKPETALKAMKADVLEAKQETLKKDTVNDYLKSKQAPKTDAPGAAANQQPPKKGGFDGAEQRALNRLNASREAT